MAAFPSRPYRLRQSFWSLSVRKHPVLLFGLPFVTIIVAASFVLQTFTQTRYDVQKQKQARDSKESALQMSKERRKVDLREEYFRLSGPAGKVDLEKWEPVRVPRPAGTPEWGVPPPSPSMENASSSPPDSTREKTSEEP